MRLDDWGRGPDIDFMTIIANSAFLIILIVIALIALAFGVRAFVGYRSVKADARADFDYRQREGMRGGSLAFEKFERAFLRLHAPRAAKYTAIALGAIVILTAPFLRLIDLFMTLVWRLSGESRTFEPTFLVYQFGIFFGMIGLWALIGYLSARAYHRGSAISFEEELAREYGEL